MKKMTTTPLVLAFILIGVVSLFLGGISFALTIMNNEMNQNGIMSNISWMWIPTILSILITFLLGWVIFWKKNDE
jgi:uncharacterized membrane protein (DUF485 family)